MTRTACIASATAALDDGHLFRDLQRRVAMRTESDAGAAPETLAPYLHDEMVPALQALGFDCTVLPAPNPPAGRSWSRGAPRTRRCPRCSATATATW